MRDEGTGSGTITPMDSPHLPPSIPSMHAPIIMESVPMSIGGSPFDVMMSQSSSSNVSPSLLPSSADSAAPMSAPPSAPGSGAQSPKGPINVPSTISSSSTSAPPLMRIASTNGTQPAAAPGSSQSSSSSSGGGSGWSGMMAHGRRGSMASMPCGTCGALNAVEKAKTAMMAGRLMLAIWRRNVSDRMAAAANDTARSAQRALEEGSAQRGALLHQLSIADREIRATRTRAGFSPLPSPSPSPASRGPAPSRSFPAPQTPLMGSAQRTFSAEGLTRLPTAMVSLAPSGASVNSGGAGIAPVASGAGVELLPISIDIGSPPPAVRRQLAFDGSNATPQPGEIVQGPAVQTPSVLGPNPRLPNFSSSSSSSALDDSQSVSPPPFRLGHHSASSSSDSGHGGGPLGSPTSTSTAPTTCAECLRRGVSGGSEPTTPHGITYLGDGGPPLPKPARLAGRLMLAIWRRNVAARMCDAATETARAAQRELEQTSAQRGQLLEQLRSAEEGLKKGKTERAHAAAMEQLRHTRQVEFYDTAQRDLKAQIVAAQQIVKETQMRNGELIDENGKLRNILRAIEEKVEYQRHRIKELEDHKCPELPPPLPPQPPPPPQPAAMTCLLPHYMPSDVATIAEAAAKAAADASAAAIAALPAGAPHPPPPPPPKQIMGPYGAFVCGPCMLRTLSERQHDDDEDSDSTREHRQRSEHKERKRSSPSKVKMASNASPSPAVIVEQKVMQPNVAAGGAPVVVITPPIVEVFLPPSHAHAGAPVVVIGDAPVVPTSSTSSTSIVEPPAPVVVVPEPLIYEAVDFDENELNLSREHEREAIAAEAAIAAATAKATQTSIISTPSQPLQDRSGEMKRDMNDDDEDDKDDDTKRSGKRRQVHFEVDGLGRGIDHENDDNDEDLSPNSDDDDSKPVDEVDGKMIKRSSITFDDDHDEDRKVPVVSTVVRYVTVFRDRWFRRVGDEAPRGPTLAAQIALFVLLLALAWALFKPDPCSQTLSGGFSGACRYKNDYS
jgi:hypothetical protein